jgi:transcriptional regulator CtsR
MQIILLTVGILLLIGLPAADAQITAVRFAVIGDYGLTGQAELDVSNLVRSWNPDFIITTGDNNYPSGSSTTIDQNIGQYYHDFIYPYVGSYGAGAPFNQFFPSLGNHDWGRSGIQPYLDYFTLPNNGRYYDFVRGPVHLFALDSDPNEPDGNTSTSTQGAWLFNTLTASTALWKLVYFHHSPYSSGLINGSSPWMQWPFQAWGATAVLSAHDHDYERVMIGNFPYFVNGLGGDSIYVFGTPVPGSQVRFNGDFGAMLVTASTDNITFQFFTRTGALVDTHTIYAAPAPPIPLAPSNLVATVATSSQINLAWQRNSTNEDGFKIERAPDGTTFTQVATVGPGVTSYPDVGLAALTTYYYRVRAYNRGGDSSYSNTVNATTTAPVPPAAPSNLVATAVSSSQINLAWQRNSTNEDGFKIERAPDGTTFTQVATVGPGVTGYLDAGLTTLTTYYYRVRAYNRGGDSGYSNTVNATTSALAPPAAPSNLVADTVSRSQINLTWQRNSTNEDGFKIERSLDGAAFAQIATVGQGITTYLDTGLTASTQYYYRVRAYNAATGDSGYSNTDTAVTRRR